PSLRPLRSCGWLGLETPRLGPRELRSLPHIRWHGMASVAAEHKEGKPEKAEETTTATTAATATPTATAAATTATATTTTAAEKSESTESQREWAALLSLRRFIWPPEDPELRRRVVLAVTLMIASKGLGLAVPLLMKSIVDGLAPVFVVGAQTAATAATLPIAALAGYGAVRVAQSLCSELRNLAFSTVSARALTGISSDVFRHLHSLSLEYHLSRQTGAVAAIVSRGVRGLQWLLSVVVFNVAPTIFEIGLVSGLLWYTLGSQFALVNVVTIGAYSAWTFSVTTWRTQIRRTMNEAETKSGALMVDSLMNFETVKHFCGEKAESVKYEAYLSQYETGLRKTAVSLGLLNFGQQAIFTSGMTAMLVLCSQGVLAGSMSVGDLVMANALLLQLLSPLNWLGTMYSESRRSLIDLRELTALLEQPPERPLLNASASPLMLPFGDSPSLEFRDVSFGYPSSTEPLLRGVSIHVPAGTTFALVGTSGSGKSTLFRLLFRFFDPTAGSIHLADKDLRDLTVDSVRQHIGLIPQDIVLFNTTLRENLAYGRPDATTEEINDVVRAAALEGVIAGLPLGLDTMVGERGLKLSGGEKQRVAIARALLRRPSVLLVDEGTASLDSQTEFEVMSQLRAMSSSQRATTVVIAHRLSTVQHAEQIAVLHKGSVAEIGSHQERFVKRRQRLVGPNGSTLKAIELLTNCFVLVQGQTVSIMGTIKGIKQVRRIIEDCFRNIHPIYHIKELMIRRELEKDPELKEENWDRFLPHFKNRNVQRKKQKLKKKKRSKEVFPPQAQPRKEDLQMETGEYFLDEKEREQKNRIAKRESQVAKSAEKRRERAKDYEAPAAASKPKKRKAEDSGPQESAKEMAARMTKKAAASGGPVKKKREASELLL
ncbi:unnamed protein product, partial [Polarella glacialis]